MKIVKKIRKDIIRTFFRPVPKILKENFIKLSDKDILLLKEKLICKFFNQWEKSYLKTSEGNRHLQNHLINRQQFDRNNIIPWLSESMELENANILEIGCGTGSSTVALAEQGAIVTAIDINSNHLDIAKYRMKLHGLTANIYRENAKNLSKLYIINDFNIIIFFASLEHMTFNERILSLQSAWSLLDRGGLMLIIETPNRLHHFDSHSSLLPFYHWLPDNVAVEYAKYSSRDAFKEKIKSKYREEQYMNLIRFGRGISYHDLELAINLESDNIVSSLEKWQTTRTISSYLYSKSTDITWNNMYKYILSKLHPQINPIFFNPWLNIMLKK